MLLIDSHCHLDAAEFDADRRQVRSRARQAGVGVLIIPAVDEVSWHRAARLAVDAGDAWALGVHPLYVDQAPTDVLSRLESRLDQVLADPIQARHLVALGEIGLDGFVPGLDPVAQEHLCAAQLALARSAGLPVILHARRSLDRLLALLRRHPGLRGVFHAFNGSDQQARQCLDLGFKLGFGGAMTLDRALQIRRLATELPIDALVLETDAPDIPPRWRYRTAAERDADRAAGRPMPRSEPADVAGIAQELARLRGLSLRDVARLTTANLVAVVPRLQDLIEAARTGPIPPEGGSRVA
jgi:TatD DNase family protein